MNPATDDTLVPFTLGGDAAELLSIVRDCMSKIRTVEAILHAKTMRPSTTNPTLEYVVKLIANRYIVTFEEIIGPRRNQGLADARAVAMWIVRTVFEKHSLNYIGKFFGGRDHGTVLYSVRKVCRLREAYPDFRRETDALMGEIKGLMGEHGQKVLPLPKQQAG